MTTRIEWATETWNPIVGCSHCSPGCDNCYAERMARRQAAMVLKKLPVVDMSTGRGRYVGVIGADGKWNGSVARDIGNSKTGEMFKPIRMEKPRTIFVVSMGDLFHPSVSFDWIDAVYSVQCSAPQHTYIWLTKRIDRVLQWFERVRENGRSCTPNNLWIGVTVCNQEEADEKIPKLIDIPSAVRFVSIEPMLGPIDLQYPTFNDADSFHALAGLDWVIVGGESGPGARPMHPEWARAIRNQCADAGVPFFFKQWGAWVPHTERHTYPEGRLLQPHQVLYVNPDGTFSEIGKGKIPSDILMNKIVKKHTGRYLDGRIHNEYPLCDAKEYLPTIKTYVLSPIVPRNLE